MDEPLPPLAHDAAKLDEVADKIALATQHQAAAKAVHDQAAAQPVKRGVRGSAELLGAVLAGALLGYAVDEQFDWYPNGLVVGVILGAIAGMMNVWRAVNGVQRAVGLQPVPPHDPAIPEQK